MSIIEQTHESDPRPKMGGTKHAAATADLLGRDTTWFPLKFSAKAEESLSTGNGAAPWRLRKCLSGTFK